MEEEKRVSTIRRGVQLCIGYYSDIILGISGLNFNKDAYQGNSIEFTSSGASTTTSRNPDRNAHHLKDT